MQHQSRKMPGGFTWIATSLSGFISIFLICQVCGSSLLTLFEDVKELPPLTQGLLFLIQMSWTGWFGLFATWAVASFFIFKQQREK